MTELKSQFDGHLAVVLHSEGNPTRIEKIFQHHFENQETSVFDAVSITDQKSRDSYQISIECGLQTLRQNPDGPQLERRTIVVGENLQNDIEPGNLVGALTVYVPGDYKGVETPSRPTLIPFRVGDHFSDAIDCVEGLMTGEPPQFSV